MNKNAIREELERHNFEIVKEARYKNSAWRFKLSNKVSVFCGDGNKIWCLGKNKDKVNVILKELEAKQKNTKVFIAYGHDKEAKDELIDMVQGWGLTPLTIDNLPSSGRTIIEQLVHYIPETNYAIVLATPDDVGCKDDGKMDYKHRARQNVILELGMLFMKLDRSRVTVLIKKCKDFEKPSDIDGVLYKEYENSVSEMASKIKNELRSLGYDV